MKQLEGNSDNFIMLLIELTLDDGQLLKLDDLRKSSIELTEHLTNLSKLHKLDKVLTYKLVLRQ